MPVAKYELNACNYNFRSKEKVIELFRVISVSLIFIQNIFAASDFVSGTVRKLACH